MACPIQQGMLRFWPWSQFCFFSVLSCVERVCCYCAIIVRRYPTSTNNFKPIFSRFKPKMSLYQYRPRPLDRLDIRARDGSLWPQTIMHVELLVHMCSDVKQKLIISVQKNIPQCIILEFLGTLGE